jgi:hypothetical protein
MITTRINEHFFLLIGDKISIKILPVIYFSNNSITITNIFLWISAVMQQLHNLFFALGAYTRTEIFL